MAVNQNSLALIAQMRSQLEGITDQQIRDLVRAWVTAWDEVSSELSSSLIELMIDAKDGRVTRNQMLQSVRLRNALASIGTQLGTLSTRAGIRITADLANVVNTAGRAQETILASQLPINERDIVNAWTRVDTAQITAIVDRSTHQITSTLKPLSRDATRVMKRELIRGVAVGDNPRTTASRIVRSVEGRFNGGLARALTVARTEMLDAHRQAAYLAQQHNADVLSGWIWTASLSSRTCPACWSLNGQEFPLDQPGPEGHQNCVLPGAIVSGPRAQASSTRWFDGEVIELQVRGRDLLTVTPNHPILTSHGWVAAGELREGDHVLTGSGTDRPSLKRSPDDYQVPALIEDVAQSLGRSLPVLSVSMPTAAENFHGDGAGSKVHVVRTHSLLGDYDSAPLSQVVRESDLMLRSMGLPNFTSGSPLRSLLDTALPTPYRLMRGRHVGAVLLGRTCQRHQTVRVSRSSSFDSNVIKRPANVLARDFKLGSQPQNRLPGEVAVSYPLPSSEDLATFAGTVSDSVVTRVERRRWSGHVYNLQTETGWYLANNILTHNCRCVRVSQTKSWADLGFEGIEEPPSLLPDSETMFDQLSAGEQEHILGATRYAAWKSGDYPMSKWATKRHNDGWRDSWHISRVPSQSLSDRLAS